MIAARAVKIEIEGKGPGSYWRVSDFPEFSPLAVAKTLARMAKSGKLSRVSRGVYFYPKTTVLGPTKPNTFELAKELLGDAKSTDLTALYNLGLSSQVPATLTFVSERAVKLAGAKVIKRHSNGLTKASEKEFWIVEALKRINRVPDATTDEALLKLKSYIRSNRVSLDRLARLAVNERPRVRALVGAIGDELGIKKESRDFLKSSLSPFTIYKVGVKKSLKAKNEWRLE